MESKKIMIVILLLLPFISSAQSKSLKYQWRKISGPSQYTIVSPLEAVTKVTNVVEGTYKFELKVTNQYNLCARDTMVLTVKAPLFYAPATATNKSRSKKESYRN